MHSYAVLDRNESIRRHTLLEASAGTGKTFSIENLVVRLLCEEPALTIDQILVVTFTRASTRELKERIRKQLYTSLEQLGGGDESMADYLFALVENGEAVETYRRLSEALFAYEEAQIFTIHGFCYRMLQEQQLEGGVVVSNSDTLSLPPSEVLRVIHDFFRTELTGELISAGQLRRLLRAHSGDAEQLAEALRRLVCQPEPILPDLSYAELLDAFSVLEGRPNIRSEEILNAFHALAPCYKKTTNRQGQILPELLQAVEREAELLSDSEWTATHFDEMVASGLQLIAALDPAMKKVRAKEPEGVKCLETLDWLRSNLLPLVKRASDPTLLFATVAHHCQKMIHRVFEEKEWLSPDLLLKRMSCSVEEPLFSDRIRARYQAAIVDEFQDTDPLQWSIFSTLFIHQEWPGHLYLVGDPKQSIYAFRQADIYTYLSAAKLIGEDNRAILSTNYRSTKELIGALNLLFDRDDLFPLPRIKASLGYVPVEVPDKSKAEAIEDHLGAVHFMVAEATQGRSKRWPTEGIEEQFFTFLGNEVIRLHKEQGLPFSSTAVLVRDRYQATRLAEFLDRRGIPSLLRRDRLLTTSTAYLGVMELLEALLDPHHLSSLKVALGGLFFALTPDELREDAALTEWRCLFGFWSRCWREKGVASMFEEVMYGEKGVAYSILERDQELFSDFQQWSELLSDLSIREQLTPERLLERMHGMDGIDSTEDATLRANRDTQVDAVQLLTMHVSKGLEFDVVFALGLANRTSHKELFARTENGLQAVSQNPSAAERHREELDAEKMRQLYVAMTRAKRRLYLPLLLQSDLKTPPAAGEASPMELYWHLGQDKSRAIEWLESQAKEASISFSLLSEGDDAATFQEASVSPTLMPPPPLDLKEAPLFIHSYSSLVHNHSGGEVRLPEGPATLHSLPAGARTGVILHTLLESVDFCCPESIQTVSERVLMGGELEPWLPAVVEAVQKLANLPMPFGTSLSQVDKITRELSFLYGENPGDHLFTGFIDCLVEVEGKLYMIDWKSNWLGVDGSCYTDESLQKAMEDHDYYLQASIYAAAMKRFCEQAEKGDFASRFGGAIYLFLRGVPDGNGICFFQPEPYVHTDERRSW